MNKLFTAFSLSALLIAQSAFATTFNFTKLLDPTESASVSLTSDGITATATTTSSDGLGVSFNQGLGVLNTGGSKTGINNGDRINISFDQAVDIETIGMRQWGEATGGDSANIISTLGTQFLSGAGDQGNGTVDLFSIELTNITELSIVGLGNVDNSAIGDFFLGQLNNVTLAASTPTPAPTPTPTNPVPTTPTPAPAPTVPVPTVPAPVPVPAAIWLFGSGLIGLVGSTRKQSM